MADENKLGTGPLLISIAVIVGGILLAMSQPDPKELRRRFLEEERRAGRVSGLRRRRRRSRKARA